MAERELFSITDIQYEKVYHQDPIFIAGFSYGIENGIPYITVGEETEKIYPQDFMIIDYLVAAYQFEKKNNPEATKSQRISVLDLAKAENWSKVGIRKSFYRIKKTAESDLPQGMSRLTYCKDEEDESLLLSEPSRPLDLIRENTVIGITGIRYGQLENGRYFLFTEQSKTFLPKKYYKMLHALTERFDSNLQRTSPAISLEEMSSILQTNKLQVINTQYILREMLSRDLPNNMTRLVHHQEGLILTIPQNIHK